MKAEIFGKAVVLMKDKESNRRHTYKESLVMLSRRYNGSRKYKPYKLISLWNYLGISRVI